MYRPANFMLSRATSNNVLCLALMPKWFSAIRLQRQYVFNKAKPHLLLRFLARKRHRVSAQLTDGVVGRTLLRLLLAAAPSRRKTLLSNLCRHLEALAVVRPLFVEQVIGGRHALLALRELLQQRLVVATRVAGGGTLDL